MLHNSNGALWPRCTKGVVEICKNQQKLTKTLGPKPICLEREIVDILQPFHIPVLARCHILIPKNWQPRRRHPHKLFLKATTANESSLHMSRMINVSFFTIVFFGPAPYSACTSSSFITDCMISDCQMCDLCIAAFAECPHNSNSFPSSSDSARSTHTARWPCAKAAGCQHSC